ncbi:MAG: c-type cytochrome, partial [Planctomycetaceae bacterium]|nr:c-type cytochrome [Planctomycetaceae bacterium]
MTSLCLRLLLCLFVLLPMGAFAQDDQDDDDDELRPGLWATYRSGPVAIEQMDRDVVLNAGEASVDSRLPAGPLTVSWSGQILLRTEEKYRFHAYVHGRVAASVAGKEVLSGATEQPQWISGPEVSLTFGEHPVVVTATDIRGPLKWYWSAESFPLEPVPHHALFHAPEPAVMTQSMHGRALYQALRCAACHDDGSPDPSTRGPTLVSFGEGTARESLLARLTRTTPEAHGRMPGFGFNNEDAAAIVAFLQSVRKDVALPSPPKLGDAKDRAAGTELVKSLGCLACHTWAGLGQTSIWSGSPLDDIAKRRQPAWLMQWLADPTKLNAHARMPTFTLTDTERRQIVSALMGETKSISVDNRRSKDVSDDIIARGKRLVEEARCAACHEIPGVGKHAVMLRGARNRKRGGDASGCLSAKADITRKQPGYRRDDLVAVTAYLDSASTRDSALNDFARGRDLLAQKNCTACHDRDGSRGLSGIVRDVVKSVPTWEGQAPTLVPPALTAVGDRMRDDPLAAAIKGEQKPRMTWLKVRMPKFKHTDIEAKAIIAHLVGHDRIPDEAPATPMYPIHPDIATADTQTLLAGRELAGGKGFSCVACHQLKDYQPPKVALGTRGSDLYQLGARLRPNYFFRWMRSPLRILPGVEMPGYQRPHPTLLDGQLDKQLAALWDALHDPNFTAPTNPAVVEQLWTLQPGDKPRVLRDVVTIPGEKGQTESIPRAIAIGFGNGHSILFDADTATVRMWTLGDFARQRTQGKSWFWDMAGSPLMQVPAEEIDFSLQIDIRNRGGISEDLPDLPPKTQLISIEQKRDAVELTYHVLWTSEENFRKETLLGIIHERWSEIE